MSIAKNVIATKMAKVDFSSKKEILTPRIQLKSKSVFDDYDENLKISDYRTDIIIQEQVKLRCSYLSISFYCRSLISLISV
jgi:hypothetical protein